MCLGQNSGIIRFGFVKSMIKTFVKKLVVLILNWETKIIIRKYRPKIIGVTGSVGKTSTKEAITAVLATKYQVRGSAKSYNSEFGVPLTVIGCPTAWNSLTGWLRNIYQGLSLIFTASAYPEWLVLEVGADRPGDIKNLVKWLNFEVAVVTRLPDIPVHIEFFKSKEEVVEEKMSLPLSIKENGLVVLNADDENIISYQKQLAGRVLTYGFKDTADVRASEAHITYQDETPTGFAFKVDCEGNNLPVRVHGAVGLHLVYPVLAALATGSALGVNLVSAIEALAAHVPPPGRLRLITGLNGSTILDDTYNSSPVALEAALKTLGEINTTGRKFAVIGNMMELGKHTAEAHRQAGLLATQVAQFIVTVGVRAKFAHEAIVETDFPAEALVHFDDSVSAGEYLSHKIAAHDVILVKGSQSARMEKVVAQLMAGPEQKKELLVRQEKEWEKR